eukprot:CAMPEP_0115120632 /NCGR_PEP_ID=MMETSP0227-20121206/45802_1 /TAXON_ID=89957 /ORGANISM="Polarella glacialis, Strain CCMP 1383" /LENGTH=182 /DNA_ID=CAMNT_0002522329 /DNA_START=38 /DNA_END=586 /DNA_ORIENTATION=+
MGCAASVNVPRIHGGLHFSQVVPEDDMDHSHGKRSTSLKLKEEKFSQKLGQKPAWGLDPDDSDQYAAVLSSSTLAKSSSTLAMSQSDFGNRQCSREIDSVSIRRPNYLDVLGPRVAEPEGTETFHSMDYWPNEEELANLDERPLPPCVPSHEHHVQHLNLVLQVVRRSPALFVDMVHHRRTV